MRSGMVTWARCLRPPDLKPTALPTAVIVTASGPAEGFPPVASPKGSSFQLPWCLSVDAIPFEAAALTGVL